MTNNNATAIIAAWDFFAVVSSATKHGMPENKAEAALDELKAFLLQCALHPDLNLSPQSAECDDLWHEFIVADTRAYHRFCNAVYGGYLHHDGVTLSSEALNAARANSASVFGKQTDTECGRIAECGRVSTNVECGRLTECGRISAKPECGRIVAVRG